MALSILTGPVSDPLVFWRTLVALACVVSVIGLALSIASYLTDAGNRLVPLSRTVVGLIVALVLTSGVVLAQEGDPGGIPIYDYKVCEQLEPWSWWWIVFGCYARAMLLMLLRAVVG